MLSERAIDTYFPHARSNIIARHISGPEQQLLLSDTIEMNFICIISYIKTFFLFL